jgi:hypothetical protein
LILSIVGVQSRGWQQVTRRQCWYLWASTVAAVLGAGPMALVCALALVAAALTAIIGLMICFALFVLLLVARRR